MSAAVVAAVVVVVVIPAAVDMMKENAAAAAATRCHFASYYYRFYDHLSYCLFHYWLTLKMNSQLCRLLYLSYDRPNLLMNNMIPIQCFPVCGTCTIRTQVMCSVSTGWLEADSWNDNTHNHNRPYKLTFDTSSREPAD